MPKIEILLGMIASGKSSYTKRRANEGAIVVNDDAIVTAVHGGDYTLYSEELKSLYKSIETHIIVHSISIGRDVVIDRPNFLISTRQRYIGLANMLDCESILVVFDKNDPLIHAQRRFNSDPRGHSLDYWIMVAKKHEDEWEEPIADEGFSEIIKHVWSEK